jgi:hypothetical protein
MPAPPLSADWQIGARGGDDFWVRAEKFVAQRVSGQVDRKFRVPVQPTFMTTFHRRDICIAGTVTYEVL